MADKYINRDKLLEAYGDCIVAYCLQPKHGLFPTYGETALWDYIETMPTIEAEPRWIPCSERLPEKNGLYLSTTLNREVYCDYWNGINFDRTEFVIAWMPLPEPYKVVKP